MAKIKVRYVCENCGSAQPKWMGKCPDCGDWNTLVERQVMPAPSGRAARSVMPLDGGSEPLPLPDISSDGLDRIPVKGSELSRVLGGGIVPGSVVLVSGDPGIGKSTLLLQLAADMARSQGNTLYVSAEESARQLKIRAGRLGIDEARLYVHAEIHLENILHHASQLQSCAADRRLHSGHLLRRQPVGGRQRQPGAGMRGPVAASGKRAGHAGLSGGPRDQGGFHRRAARAGAHGGHGALPGGGAVPDLPAAAQRQEPFRLHRRDRRVRDGRIDGLQEVANPSEAFLAERLPNAAGSAIAVTMEGTRPLLVEVQALASTTSFPQPRRTANGVDFNRLLLLTAVLSKRVGLRLSDQDVFVNVVGGLHISEPAADLAVAVAIVSSIKNLPVPADLAVVGEVGLSGELRSVSQLPRRLNEAAKLGFTRCIVPKSRSKSVVAPEGMTLIGVRTLQQALDAALKSE